MKTLLLLLVFTFSFSSALAEEADKEPQSAWEHAFSALKLSGQAAVHGSVAILGGLAASGKATLAVLSVPVAASGKVAQTSGEILEKGADKMETSAHDDFSRPLPVSDRSVTVGPPPDAAMTGKTE